ncbi:DeoR/GlpR family DNA-binding transcription regulator [Paenibacillus eucommiae]|uniref:DeoR/GlpR family transcriptional regulator of sugar metabolism n=1 Tax=Paenibacillus eucommiae TaxID=1355755 RepID=A0ABS4J0Q7_9BACL|nr:DeoR/GlpR family DNA-binding transcription regulator [Paenibacillus eucommiae]MBP1993388.1 DeoR/GlpR family transcriptional regulator of sugar metabolism [Paenibacillus eucommiae]
MSDKPISKGQLRRNTIMQILKQNGRIALQDILQQFQCSEATARRDLDVLAEQASVIRTIGGAVYDGLSSVREVSFAEKTDISWLEKEAIAAKAVTLIEEGDIVGLSGGTTTYLIAKGLKHMQGITVVTNAVNIAMELSDAEDIQVVLTGGIMRKKSFELCGPLAVQMVEALHINKMFLGIDGLSAAHGISTYSELEAQIAKTLMSRSAHTYAVFDATKVGRSSLFSIAPLSALYACVTNEISDKMLAASLEEHQIQVYLASTTTS